MLSNLLIEIKELGYSSNAVELDLTQLDGTIINLTKEGEEIDEYMCDSIGEVELFLTESIKAIKEGKDILQSNLNNPLLYLQK